MNMDQAFRAWREEEIAILRDRIALVEAGTVKFHSQTLGEPMVDTTAATLEADKKALAHLEGLSDAHRT